MEFNLSKKIIDFGTDKTELNYIYDKHIKEFIRLLKEEIRISLVTVERITLSRFIDKLAGDKFR